MRNLEDVKGAEGIAVVGDMLEPIYNIASSEKNSEARKGGNLKFATAILKNNAQDVLELLTAWTGEDCSQKGLISMMKLVMEMLNDPLIQELFGLQSRTSTSSSSATTITEAEA